MPTLSRTSLALALLGATALAPAAPAAAHDGTPTTTSWPATTLDLRAPLNADVYAERLDAKLDHLADYANALRARVAAIPSDEVLTGLERKVAKARLAKAAWVKAALAKIPTTGVYALTAAQQAQVAAIRADLAAIVERLRLLLANEAPAPVVVPTSVKPVRETLSLREVVKAFGDRECDGWHDGDRDGWDGWRDWDGRWDGDRDGR